MQSKKSSPKRNTPQINEPQLRYNFTQTDQEVVIDFLSVKAKPFLKWAGGKSQIIDEIIKLLPKTRIRNYFEPFLGGGAVFFSLQPTISNLSDSNNELIEVYRTVRDYVDELIIELEKYPNESSFFYEIRKKKSAELNQIERAARFIYLNKTCYNGLYRVNSKSEFNVPFGKYKNPLICDKENLKSVSLSLQHSRLAYKDFEEATQDAGKEDFIYFDPPYQPLSKTSSFTSYTKDRFDDKEQYRLSKTFRDLDSRGCLLMLSNSNADLIKELYQGFFIHEVQATRAINCKPGGRGKITELIITNY